jgi:alpha-L-fucosidase 2
MGDIPYSVSLALDAYVRPNSPKRPSVVVIHGGGWSSGSRIAHVGQILEALTRAGYNWFSLDYRLGGLQGYEDSLTDVRAALAFIRCRAPEFGIDPDRLVLLGEDTGAQLAALVAASDAPGVVGAVLIGGFYGQAAIAELSPGLDGNVVARASPESRVAPGMPPLLVVHGGADTEAPAPQARAYCSRVTEAGGRCQYLEVEGASHRSENWFPSQWGYKRAMVEWLAPLGRMSGSPRTARGGRLRKDIVYDQPSQLRLDARIPVSRKPVPAVIIVHGGGWEAGDKVTYVTPLFEPLSQASLAWFSIDYRLTPEFTLEDQLKDLRQAIRFVRTQHKRFNIDPARIVLVGESASGQMVTHVAAEDGQLAGVVSFYGVYDFDTMVTDASPRSLLVRLFRRTVLDDASRSELRRYSPLFRAHRNMPPILMVNGTGERLWTQGQAFATRLAALGVPHEVIALEGAPHGMENWEGHPQWLHYKRRVVDWILRVTGSQ